MKAAGYHILVPLANLFLLGLGLGLEAADLLLGQRRGVLLLLGSSQPELQVGHLPLQLHDPGALRHRGYLQHNRRIGSTFDCFILELKGRIVLEMEITINESIPVLTFVHWLQMT